MIHLPKVPMPAKGPGRASGHIGVHLVYSSPALAQRARCAPRNSTRPHDPENEGHLQKLRLVARDCTKKRCFPPPQAAALLSTHYFPPSRPQGARPPSKPRDSSRAKVPPKAVQSRFYSLLSPLYFLAQGAPPIIRVHVWHSRIHSRVGPPRSVGCRPHACGNPPSRARRCRDLDRSGLRCRIGALAARGSGPDRRGRNDNSGSLLHSSSRTAVSPVDLKTAPWA